MTALAPTLEAFFTERLPQHRASPHTVAAYRDTWRLLLCWIQTTTGTAPHQLGFEDLDTTTIVGFLDHLETDRHAAIATRNARLSAIHSFFVHAATRHPEHAAGIARVLAIGPKRADRTIVTYLTTTETEALLTAPDPTTRRGRRDRALLQLALQTGLRASELVGLQRQDVHTDKTGAHVACHGKGRKDRYTPLTTVTTAVLREWLTEHHAEPAGALFPGPSGNPLTRDALRRLLDRHITTARQHCPSLRTKRVTPHVLRHTCAMRLLEAGVDTSVIALWLGHESPRTTQIYLHAHLALKEQALARTTPAGTPPGRYQPADKLLAFLNSL
jgi:integrase/recombinase XerD